MSENQQKDGKQPKTNALKRLGGWFLQKKEKFMRDVHERTKDVKHAKAKRIALFVSAGVFAILFLVFYLTLGKMIAEFIQDADAFKNWMDGFEPTAAILVFLALRILQTAFKLVPGGALEIAAGFIFGIWRGFWWSMLGSVLGSILILWLGRKYGLRMVGLFVDPEKMHSTPPDGHKKKYGVAFFLLYFLPWTPKDIFTWIASVTEDRPIFFMLISSLARIPSVFVSAWCGAAIVAERYLMAFVILGVLIVFGVLGGMIYKAIAKNREKHALEKQNTEPVEEQSAEE